MTSPEVSVLMSVYNGAADLSRSLDSILNQTFSNFECVVVNDGSTDETAAILDRYAESDGRIVVIHQENTGLTRALNVGLEHCQASLIARQDADDVSHPDRLEQQVSFLSSNPGVVLLGTGVRLLDGEYRPYRTVSVPCTDAEIVRAMWKRNRFFHSSTMFRRDAVEKVGGYDPAFRQAQDYELWLALMEQGEAANLDQPLVDLYQGPNRISRKKARAQVSAALQAKKKHRRGRVLCKAPMHLFYWQLRGYILPPGTWNSLVARFRR
ncbi:MAG: hypothetical protein CMH54_11975 [Myxococcales bacterium]|nr:hypothetical protein [Myxococcales bacterium]|tara:strand:- start:659 stop:1459 length:801 start_codon:yes stop_codon:yes gene_type:complete